MVLIHPRYCGRRQQQRYSASGEALPGTRLWCEQYGLNEDADLKRRVLEALKSSQGAAIFLDDDCILQGKQIYLSREQPRRGRPERPVVERRTRRRSRSPSKARYVRQRERSRTPLAICRRSMSTESNYSIGELRPRQAMQYKRGSNAVVFEAAETRLQRVSPAPVLQRPSQSEQGPPLFGCATSIGKSLSFVQNFQRRLGTASVANEQGACPTLPFRFQAETRAAALAPQEEWVDDPHFVLGVNYAAGEEESDLHFCPSVQ